MLPSGLGVGSHRRDPLVVLETTPITPEMLAEAAETLESNPVPLLPTTESQFYRIRGTHHRLAQLVAMGAKDVDAGRVTGFSPAYITNLKKSPAFQELISHYSTVAEEVFVDFVERAKDLSIDMMDRLREMLEESPEKFSPRTLVESIGILGDRAGFAPTQKTVNLNVNANMGDRLREARERAAEAARMSQTLLQPPDA